MTRANRTARLYGLIARKARRAVIFRRGPSKSVRMLLWNLATDEIEPGQWFKGRIYERRCDLTEHGDLLAYFAASYRQPLYSWTAISKPPYFTALALWKKGDGWGGGGLFDKSRNFRLNHRAGEMALGEGFALPKSLKLSPLGERSGSGEDDPILTTRLLRDGWAFSEMGNVQRERRKSIYMWTFDPPVTIQKPLDRNNPGGGHLRTHLHAINESQGRWYVETADIADGSEAPAHDIGRIDWTDLDHNGDVLYAKDGCLFRLRIMHDGLSLKSPAIRQIADLNDMTFTEIETPDAARRW